VLDLVRHINNKYENMPKTQVISLLQIKGCREMTHSENINK
jgi:hypothetical protein